MLHENLEQHAGTVIQHFHLNIMTSGLQNLHAAPFTEQ